MARSKTREERLRSLYFDQRRDGISIVLNAERGLRELGIEIPSAITPKKDRATEGKTETKDQ